jgi:calcium-dependent protein kinase
MDEIVARGNFDEKDTDRLMKQILSCVAYLHKKKIMHRDLKPENVLLENNKDVTQIKVADFGTAYSWDVEGKMPSEKVGTLIYMAPEVFNGEYDQQCDVWSCGVIMYKLLSGRFPFEADDEVTLRQKLMKGEFDLSSSFWKGISSDAKDLISQMLRTKPNERIRAEDAVKHKWFNTILKGDPTKPKDAIVIGALKNLVTFRATDSAMVSIYSFFSSELLSKSELGIVTSVFKALDFEGDGMLGVDEL